MELTNYHSRRKRFPGTRAKVINMPTSQQRDLAFNHQCMLKTRPDQHSKINVPV